MTAKSNTWETALLQLVFQNINAANIGDATGLRGSAAPGQLYVSLHTADPGEAGNQSTSEVSYTGYGRLAVNRAAGAGGFVVSGNAVSLGTQPSSFPACTGGSAVATHFGIGTSPSGAGVLLYKGAIASPVNIASGVVPQVNALNGTEE